MQTYSCQHCRTEHETVFTLFLHIFTDHMHVNIGLLPAESRGLILWTEPYKVAND